MKFILIHFSKLVLSTVFRAFRQYFGKKKTYQQFFDFEEGLVYRITWNVQFKTLMASHLLERGGVAVNGWVLI